MVRTGATSVDGLNMSLSMHTSLWAKVSSGVAGRTACSSGFVPLVRSVVVGLLASVGMMCSVGWLVVSCVYLNTRIKLCGS